MEVTPFKHIRLRLLLLFLAGVASVVIVVLILNRKLGRSIDANRDVSEMINIAGRQRMLSQNISKQGLLFSYKIDTNTFKLDSLIDLFESSDLLLRKRTNELNTDETLEINGLYQAIVPYRDTLVTVGRQLKLLKEDRVAQSHLQPLLRSERAILPLLDAITVKYEQISIARLSGVKRAISYSDYFIALVVIISAATVLIFTMRSLRSYSNNLAQSRLDLEKAHEEANFRIQKLEFLTNAIQVGVWERSIQEKKEGWSSQLYRIFGFEPQEIVGTFDAFFQRVHPTDKQSLMDASEVSLKTGLPSTVNLRVLTKDNGYKWVEATGNVMRDAQGKVSLMMGGIIDINDRKKLENQLKEFVENAPAAIAMFNANMEYIAVSSKWIEDYHIQDRILIGVSHYTIFPEISDEWKAIHKRCLNGAIEQRDEDGFEREDGTLQWQKWEVRPWYVSEDEIGGILMFTQDITDLKSKNEELRIAKENAEMASKAKQEFLATMSHEIRTPLNAINGITHLLIDEDPNPDQIEYLNLLKFSGENLLTLVNDILDIGKIDSGKLKLEASSFSLYDLIQNIKRSLLYKALENEVQIETTYDPKLSHFFIGDVTRISQIIYNLAGNAIKFTKNGVVKIDVRQIKAGKSTSQLEVSVSDTGIGIAEENRERIFKSFEQADSGTTRQFGGTGLGLYITKNLLELMDSEIKLESEVGKGSRFFFQIELEIGQEVATVTTSHKLVEDLSEKRLKVLIAEDNLANQLILKRFLQKYGVGYEVAENGLEVLDLIMTKAFDMILMDIRMPIMDGFTASLRIRSQSDPYYQKIPIIALTADAFATVKEKAFESGITDYLSKPFKPSTLYQILDKYSGRVNKTEDQYSKISRVINSYGQNDPSFKKEFTSSAIYNYKEFISEITACMTAPDGHRLFMAVHKIHSLNSLLDLYEFSGHLAPYNSRELTIMAPEDGARIIMTSEEIISHLNKLLEE